jgi:hypothetical protein
MEPAHYHKVWGILLKAGLVVEKKRISPSASAFAYLKGRYFQFQVLILFTMWCINGN